MKKQIYTSIVLVLLALAAVTAATVAWFSIADNTRVRTMSLDIVTDVDMRMDLDPHSTLEQYVRTLSFDQIAERMHQEKGFSMKETPLEPVTTSDQTVFTYENGTEVADTKGVSDLYLAFYGRKRYAGAFDQCRQQCGSRRRHGDKLRQCSIARSDEDQFFHRWADLGV